MWRAGKISLPRDKRPGPRPGKRVRKEGRERETRFYVVWAGGEVDSVFYSPSKDSALQRACDKAVALAGERHSVSVVRLRFRGRPTVKLIEAALANDYSAFDFCEIDRKDP